MLAGLGVILSTRKRRSPICWTMTLVNLAIVRTRARGGRGVVGLAVAGLVGGFIMGVAARAYGVDIENLDAGIKKD
ncbi:hypothetical protein TrRE_jg9853 [Triparma retinervis]|uniref:Uncharacterized protein n=1 Tax=Triparma retinervis TaxID=2557542 RepID=A0A9W6ZER1_9STRA|nr:hypothetical protein TrRE_jg9853 [Triparma retinervis]